MDEANVSHMCQDYGRQCNRRGQKRSDERRVKNLYRKDVFSIPSEYLAISILHLYDTIIENA